jgi:hypothetical protein
MTAPIVPPSPFAHGSLLPGVTATEAAAYMAVAPEWDFAANPVNAIGHASGSAAHAYGIENHDAARLWTEIGLRLVAIAANPYVVAGGVLTDLAARYGVVVP